MISPTDSRLVRLHGHGRKLVGNHVRKACKRLCRCVNTFPENRWGTGLQVANEIRHLIQNFTAVSSRDRPLSPCVSAKPLSDCLITLCGPLSDLLLLLIRQSLCAWVQYCVSGFVESAPCSNWLGKLMSLEARVMRLLSPAC